MSSDNEWWAAPPLTAEERRLADAYATVGRSLEFLPYTEDFEKLRRLVDYPDTSEARQLLYKQLLRLNGMGRLVGFGWSSSSTSSSSR